MAHKEQNKILDAKIESNVNQYKVDRLNAEISAFSSGDLNKCEFLKRIDLNYKPNALDKARFEFSPLGTAFNEVLDKTIPNYQEEGVIKLLKEIRDNSAGLPMPLGPPSSPSLPPSPPSSPSLPPSPPGSPSLPPGPPSSPNPPGSPSLTNITTPSSSSLTNLTPLRPPDSSKKTRTVRSRSKLLQFDSQKFLGQLKLEASQRPRPKSPPVIPIIPTHKTDSDGTIKKIKGQSKKYDIKEQQEDEFSKLLKKQKDELNKFYKNQKKKDTDLDDLIKELNEKIEKNKLLKQYNKLLKQQNRQKKILEQNNLLEQQKQEEEDIPWYILNELSKNANEMTENINSESPTILRTFAPRRDPFDDINENKEKSTPSPITKSLELKGLAAGEQASIEIMKNDFKNSNNYIEYLKKELNNTELFIAKIFKN